MGYRNYLFLIIVFFMEGGCASGDSRSVPGRRSTGDVGQVAINVSKSVGPGGATLVAGAEVPSEGPTDARGSAADGASALGPLSVRLVIPEGALSDDQLITIEPAHRFPPDPKLVPGTTKAFGPEGLAFNRPVRLELYYDPDQAPPGLDERTFCVHKVVAHGWRPVPGCAVDLELHVVAGRLSGFSTYGVRATDPASRIDAGISDASPSDGARSDVVAEDGSGSASQDGASQPAQAGGDA